ncbi:putative alcohol dehydrogenase adh domain protein [Mycobacterium xenopi 4042]|uniref:Putative alcohol dehydrogenase adh domain protein n=1 Tax=Mycobacterium xenopi 4042 TaxID=1299334 RepID=X8DKM6_MYCXE|nr:putative alcohol dehydrogenase adh domain protein [Mycobacterium xenopi 4042]
MIVFKELRVLGPLAWTSPPTGRRWICWLAAGTHSRACRVVV